MARKITTIDDLTTDAKNANLGTPRGAYMVRESLKRYGAGRSILVDQDGNVIAGNKTLEAAEEAGIPVRVIQTDGSELVVVQRTDLDLNDGGAARELAYMDNRASEVGLAWDMEQVALDIQNGVDLTSMFLPHELAEVELKTNPDSAGEGEPGPTMQPSVTLVITFQDPGAALEAAYALSAGNPVPNSGAGPLNGDMLLPVWITWAQER